MRVLIDYRPALRERSGVGEYTHRLVHQMLADHRAGGGADAARPLDLTIFSSSWKDRLVGSAELDGATIVDRRIPVRVLNFAWHRLGWPHAEELAGRAFDVTHSLHPMLLPSPRAAQVITIHDLDFLNHPERTRAEIRRDYPALVRDHARRADGIIVPSEFTAREVRRQLGITHERVAICPAGAPEWAPRAEAPADGYILFFGTLEPRKNVGGLLDAYERLVATRRALPELVLAGRAADGAHGWLARVARPPLAGRVRHLGYVDPADRQALYAGARLLVLPSFEEGFGMPLLEAMATGVPVVASNRGSLPDVIGSAGATVDPDDPEALAAAIARVLDDAAFAANGIARGLRQAREFSWERTAQRVYNLYRLAIEHRRCASA